MFGPSQPPCSSRLVLRPLLTSARSARTFQYEPSARRHPQHNRHPNRSPQVRTINVPGSPPRLRTGPLGSDGHRRSWQTHPAPHALYAVRVPRYPGLASGFLQTPPHDDALASSSGLAPPLPPGDFHPQSIAHAGRTSSRRAGSPGPPLTPPDMRARIRRFTELISAVARSA